MSFLKKWAPYFQSSVRTLGRADQLAGRVKQLPPEPGQCLLARVQGEASELVTFGDQAPATCTCSRFGGGGCRRMARSRRRTLPTTAFLVIPMRRPISLAESPDAQNLVNSSTRPGVHSNSVAIDAQLP